MEAGCSPRQRDQPRPQLLPALQLEQGRVEDDIPGEVVQVVPRPPPAQTLPACQESGDMAEYLGGITCMPGAALISA